MWSFPMRRGLTLESSHWVAVPPHSTVTDHKLARMVYFMLTRGEAFVDEGQQRYEEQQRQRSTAALKGRAAALGFQLNATAAA